ncbi:MAG: sensor histidine kinase [Bryobacteraceae bacterium]
MSIHKRGVAILALGAVCLGVISVVTGILWIALGSAGLACATAWFSWKAIPKDGPEGDFAAQLINVQEDERKRLSRELHDGVGQVITALKMELSRVKGTEADAPRLERARSHADEALNTIRNVSRILRPTLLDDLGLEAALQWHLDDFSRRTGIRTVLAYELPVEDLLTEAINTCIYRTVQESLNNCEKHSGASLVRVTVEREEQGLSISVVDNGRGLDPVSAGKDQHGIRGLRERAHILGGQFQLESDVGKGTTVNLNLPL